jgi:adenylate kinase family enzyme
MDGNYGRTLPKRLAAADTVVFLDLPRLVCTWRILKRRFSHLGQTRSDVAPGCPERMTWEFVHWVWTYRSRRRPGILRQLQALSRDKRVFVLKNPSEVSRFLANL